MFGIENSANNFGASAGLLANTLANRPIRAALGTLFIATDTLEIYRWTGSLWLLLGGGGTVFGGATNGLQILSGQVGLGGILTQNTSISAAGTYSFYFQSYTTYTIGNDLEVSLKLDNGILALYTRFFGVNKGIFLDFPIEAYSLGDNGAGTYFQAYSGVNELRTFVVGNTYGLNSTPSLVKVGEWSGALSNLHTLYDFAANRIQNNSNDGYYNFANIPVYANNAAALAGGLIVGDIYRHSGGTGEQLHIVF